MVLCPSLVPEVVAGISKCDFFLTLREDHKRELSCNLDIDPALISVVGAGYRSDLFYSRTPLNPIKEGTVDLLFVGKLSAAKGLPQLLDAWEGISREDEGLSLHVAGSGAGPEAQRLLKRMESWGSRLIYHSQLDQISLADLMRKCDICILPSFYEGIPLVLVEAYACGCRLVSTALPGVVEGLLPYMGSAINLVTPPGMVGIDTPAERDLPSFIHSLSETIRDSIREVRHNGPLYVSKKSLYPFSWRAVFERIERVWESLV